ncbi:MAG: Gfo/Idh/MocA family protein, partial [Alphaproteobacteria bacterium]
VSGGLECVAAGIPILVEKPLSTTVAEGKQLILAANQASVPVMVGHHRRHNPLVAKAKALIDGDAIGRVTAVHGMIWLFKDDDYFNVEWRRQAGGGPLAINLIHDIDMLRYLCGEIVFVQAMTSDAARGFEVEDTATALLRFENGALGTVSVSDATVSPWSWELTAAENPAYPATEQSCYLIGGSHGSLEAPNLRLWRNDGKRSWWEPMSNESLPVPPEDPLIRQIRHFAEVIHGDASPLAPGLEGLRTLAVIEAIKSAAMDGGSVKVDPVLLEEPAFG